MNSTRMENLSIHLQWETLYRMLDPTTIKRDLLLSRNSLFDRLALQYASIRRHLSQFNDQIVHSFLDKWCSANCSMLLELVYEEFDFNEVLSDISFIKRLESLVCTYILGFASQNLYSFHTTVLCLLPFRIKKLLSPIKKPKETTVFEDIQIKQQARKEIENQYIFTSNTRTLLIERSLELSGTKIHEKNEVPFRKGRTQIDHIAAKKARGVIGESKRMIETYENEKDKRLGWICDDEKDCNERSLRVGLPPLPFSFETFGYDPLKGRLADQGPLSSRRIPRGKTANTWRDVARFEVVRKEKINSRKIIDRIMETHAQIEAQSQMMPTIFGNQGIVSDLQSYD